VAIAVGGIYFLSAHVGSSRVDDCKEALGVRD
jgi:hypothetical protein